MQVVLSESWSHSSLWSEEAQMQWLDSCYCKIMQSKGEAVTFYCVQRPLGGNGQDLKRKGYSNLWIWSNNKQVHIPEIAKIPRQFMPTVQINKRHSYPCCYLNVCGYSVSRLRSHIGATKNGWQYWFMHSVSLQLIWQVWKIFKDEVFSMVVVITLLTTVSGLLAQTSVLEWVQTLRGRYWFI